MVGPEYQDMDCPKCLHRRVYADRQIGFYCMACGHGLTVRETLMLIEKGMWTSRPKLGREADSPKPHAEIRELPVRRMTRKEHAEPKINEAENRQ